MTPGAKRTSSFERVLTYQPLKMAEATIHACKGLQQNASIFSNYRRGMEIGQVDVQGLAVVCRDCEKNKVTDNVTVRQTRRARTCAIAEFYRAWNSHSGLLRARRHRRAGRLNQVRLSEHQSGATEGE